MKAGSEGLLACTPQSLSATAYWTRPALSAYSIARLEGEVKAEDHVTASR